MTTVARALRQNAMASGWAGVAAISGADVEIARTPTAMSPTSRAEGRDTALGPRAGPVVIGVSRVTGTSWQDAAHALRRRLAARREQRRRRRGGREALLGPVA